ncbi:DUF1883 domain-containing protein [Rhodococcus tukisamuensis]|uniref:TIR domain-containing protein n=1 Tax=Rhodococcus tukisamuensis TaxID=168276 RepID=A0A1G6TBC7_9NOCA|nr:DUF1883 domain-containing protein [Rhodococcus tukisamuensis]SDD25767.1 TIR domain-containing protein [Rhodococcus tukisamuensis]
MEHLIFDLKQQKKGAVAVVTLDKQANVRLMTMSHYRSFKAGRRAQMIGGLAKKSPARLGIPSDGHWVVVVDMGGLRGQVRAGVNVQPPPPGLLPPLREHNPAREVAVREPVEPQGDVLGGQTWDVFISHASEDKAAVAVPLRDALAARGVTVWLDKTEMRIGHSLRRKIDEGIRSSRYGVVVLSQSFFSKGWTNHELDGLVTKTVAGEQTLLPIWHEITGDQVRGYSPSLADKVALSTESHSIEEMADQIAEVVRETAAEEARA